jgi:ubiquinone/menaquinone biosynthesis C-methylase UbiE
MSIICEVAMNNTVEIPGSFKEMERSGWHTKASSYDDFAGRITRQVTEALLDAVNVEPGTSVLDVACGPGYGAGAAAARGANAIGVDFAAGMIAEACRNFPDIPFQQGDAENLPFDDESFDAVVCPFGLLHMSDPEKAVSEAYRVLKKSGKYSFSVWTTPETHEFFAVVMPAIQAHGNMQVPLPAAPSIFRFSDHQECIAVLATAGFSDIEVTEARPIWQADSAQEVLDMIYKGTVRTAALLQLQETSALAAIHAAILESAEKYRDQDEFRFCWPAVVASGRKPV